MIEKLPLILALITKSMLGHSVRKNSQKIFACGEHSQIKKISRLVHETFSFVQAWVTVYKFAKWMLYDLFLNVDISNLRFIECFRLFVSLRKMAGYSGLGADSVLNCRSIWTAPNSTLVLHWKCAGSSCSKHLIKL